MLFLVLNVFFILFLITFSCLRACQVCPRIVKNLSCVSFCNGFGRKMTKAFLAHFLSSIFFFCTPPFCSPTLFPLFICFPACSSHPWRLSLITWPLLLPSFLSSVCPLPSRFAPMQHLSLWQTCAITRTLSTIARLPIKGVISPQWPMPWQGWVPLPRCQPCPVAPGPSATSMTVSSARPARRPSKDSRSDYLIVYTCFKSLTTLC